ncbi:GNAT family N-acetyltransferase [Streptomyces jumonjinensis]|uniref:GNAT family N-acetyltransferase n=1 Tax=Streptomyces jumonjinensis TaxID=1945 RepID=UPI0037BBB58C
MSDLLTPRLLLHPLSPSEARRLASREPDDGALWADGYPDAGDVTGARRFLGVCAEHGDPRPFGAYEIRRRGDGRAIGGLGFHGPPDEHATVTIGYGLIPAARGRGYATEALRALLEFARRHGIACVRGDTDLGNVASQRVMAAAGMSPAGEEDRLTYYRITWAGPVG